MVRLGSTILVGSMSVWCVDPPLRVEILQLKSHFHVAQILTVVLCVCVCVCSTKMKKSISLSPQESAQILKEPMPLWTSLPQPARYHPRWGPLPGWWLCTIQSISFLLLGFCHSRSTAICMLVFPAFSHIIPSCFVTQTNFIFLQKKIMCSQVKMWHRKIINLDYQNWSCSCCKGM